MKKRLEDIKNFKIERKVFDDSTLLAIYKLMVKGFVNSVESFVMEGKESSVLSAKDKDGNWLALKVYKVEYCDFKSMWKYLAGDPRFARVKKDRRAVVFNWCRREFKNLNIVYDAGVSCPKPITFYENILVSDFIGENGNLAPRLMSMKFGLGDLQLIYEFILREMKKIVKAGLIHSDFSVYNVLFYEKPYIIDFSQAVPLKHPLAKEFLKRDIININSYFKKLDVRVKDEEQIFEKLSKMIE